MNELSPGRAVVLVGVSIVLTSCAQLLFRSVMQHFSLDDIFAIDGAGWLLENAGAINLSLLAVGLALYTCSMVVWIFALSRLSISFAYPLLSLSYVLVYLAAVYLPNIEETPSLVKLTGSITMVLGVFVMASDSISRNSRTGSTDSQDRS